MAAPLKTWILADHGKVGTYKQCQGLAQKLGIAAVFKTIKPRFPWCCLPPQLWFRALHAQSRGHDSLGPPWPDVLIAAGRASIAPALAIKRLAKNCYTVILQNPYVNPARFNCVIAPFHDHLQGENVLPVLGSLHGLEESQLSSAAQAYPHPPRTPVTAVLLGGDSRHYRYQPSDMNKLGEALKQIGGHCLVTASRRTRPELMQILKDTLTGSSHEIWQGEGANPFLAYLGLADQIIVTQDSISMATEACFTGKPVYVWELAHPSAKFQEFFHSLYQNGHARAFQWPFPRWTPRKLDEMNRVAAFVRGFIPPLANLVR